MPRGSVHASSTDGRIPHEPRMIEIRRGDLFDAEAEALVTPVHCAGIMKRGLCRQFKERFPENTRQYKAACDTGTLRPGDVLVHDRGGLFGDQDGPRYVLNVATKDHWTDTARLAGIEAGIDSVVDEVKTRDVGSIAVPALGCGGGGLDWADVRPLLTVSLAALDAQDALIYAPRSASTNSSAGERSRSSPTMTQGRALLLAILDAYATPDDDLYTHAAHNLAYLLQCDGEDLHLEFKLSPQGPHAPGLTAVLRRIAGYFIIEYDPEHPDAPFRLRPSAVTEANDVVAARPTGADRFERVHHLLGGVSSDDDLSCLATVLWITRRNSEIRHETEAVVQALHDRHDFSASQERVTAAWRRLRNRGWIG